MKPSNLLKKNNFLQNILLIVGGTAFSQVIGIMLIPVITRIYPPNQYGVLTAYTAILVMLSISASFDYQKAIPIAKSEKSAINLLALSLFLLLMTTFLVLIITAFWGSYLLTFFDMEILKEYKYLIPIGVLLSGIYTVFLHWGYRETAYKKIAKTTIIQSLISNFTKILLGILSFGPIGLVFGAIMNQSAGISSLASPLIKDKNKLSIINLSEIKKVAKRYSKFPLYSAPSNYIYVAVDNMTVIFISFLFGNHVTGLFGLANSIIRLPMNLISTSVAQVFYAESAKLGKKNPDKIKKISLNLLKKLSLIALLPLILLVFWGPELFSTVFGDQWYEAGEYARVLSIMVYFQFIASPLGRILEVFERQKEGLIFNVSRLLVIGFIFFYAVYFKLTVLKTLFIFSVANSMTYIALVVVVISIINFEIKENFKRRL